MRAGKWVRWESQVSLRRKDFGKLGRLKAVMACALACSLVASGQSVETLRLEALEGDGVFNDIRRGLSGGDVVVVVRDRSDRPIPGAKVTFTAPFSGPGLVFPNGARELVVTADDQGRARMTGAKPNKEEGRFNIKVTAISADRQTGTLVVGQSNTTAMAGNKKGGGGKAAAILSLVGGGAATGLLLALRSGGGSSGGGTTPTGPTSTSLSAGVLTVGAPR